MATGIAWGCGSIPGWQTTGCCASCHALSANVRPTRVVVSTTVMPLACCLAQNHASVALALPILRLADTLGAIGTPSPAPGTLSL